jgi:hypothetical protein
MANLLPEMLFIIMNTYAIMKPGIARLIIRIVLIIILALESVRLNNIAIGRERRKDSRTTDMPNITVCNTAAE